jgi:hypothetical protein
MQMPVFNEALPVLKELDKRRVQVQICILSQPNMNFTFTLKYIAYGKWELYTFYYMLQKF